MRGLVRHEAVKVAGWSGNRVVIRDGSNEDVERLTSSSSSPSITAETIYARRDHGQRATASIQNHSLRCCHGHDASETKDLELMLDLTMESE